MEQFFVDYMALLHDLNGKFIATFEDLPAEALDWSPGTDMNSFCALVVHTTGSARYWIGDAALGESSNRNRSQEFLAQGLSVAELQARFVTLESYVRGALERIALADLGSSRTLTNSSGEVQTVVAGWALLHALEHTGIHLGHAQLTRQLWQQRNSGTNA